MLTLAEFRRMTAEFPGDKRIVVNGQRVVSVTVVPDLDLEPGQDKPGQLLALAGEWFTQDMRKQMGKLSLCDGSTVLFDYLGYYSEDDA